MTNLIDVQSLVVVIVVVAILAALALVYAGVKMERAANRSAVQYASVTNGRSYTRFAHKNDHLGE